MKTLPASKARARLFPLIRDAERDGPVQVTSRDGSVVLISAADWNAWMTTFEIMSQPKLMRRIREAARTPISKMKRYEDIV